MIKKFTSATIERKLEFGTLYRSQISVKTYNAEIREIMQKVRPTWTLDQIKGAKKLRLQEIVIFISQNGSPAGYELDDEMQNRVERYERVQSIIKAASWIREKRN